MDQLHSEQTGPLLPEKERAEREFVDFVSTRLQEIIIRDPEALVTVGVPAGPHIVLMEFQSGKTKVIFNEYYEFPQKTATADPEEYDCGGPFPRDISVEAHGPAPPRNLSEYLEQLKGEQQTQDSAKVQKRLLFDLWAIVADETVPVATQDVASLAARCLTGDEVCKKEEWKDDPRRVALLREIPERGGDTAFSIGTSYEHPGLGLLQVNAHGDISSGCFFLNIYIPKIDDVTEGSVTIEVKKGQMVREEYDLWPNYNVVDEMIRDGILKKRFQVDIAPKGMYIRRRVEDAPQLSALDPDFVPYSLEVPPYRMQDISGRHVLYDAGAGNPIIVGVRDNEADAWKTAKSYLQEPRTVSPTPELRAITRCALDGILATVINEPMQFGPSAGEIVHQR